MKSIHLTFCIILISIFSLLFAFYLQIEINLTPCKLCVWQRWPHVLNIIIVLMLVTSSIDRRILLCIGVTNMFLAQLLAAYHFGLEEGYWVNVFTCSGIPDLNNVNTKDLLESLKNTPISSCEQPQWALLGISLAGWNTFVSLILNLLWWFKVYLFFSNYKKNIPAK